MRGGSHFPEDLFAAANRREAATARRARVVAQARRSCSHKARLAAVGVKYQFHILPRALLSGLEAAYRANKALYRARSDLVVELLVSGLAAAKDQRPQILADAVKVSERYRDGEPEANATHRIPLDLLQELDLFAGPRQLYATMAVLLERELRAYNSRRAITAAQPHRSAAA